jgi:hypothetical protein
MSNNPNPFGSPSPYGQNPYGQDPYGGQNPYSSPNFAGPPGGQAPLGAKLIAPAIGLLITGIFGMLMTIISIVMALGPPPPIDPNAPPFLQEFQKGANGPQAVVIQSVFIFVNLFIIIGAVLMMLQKMRGVGIAASVVAMLNFGNCCCLLGIPVGIWSLIILLQPDVKAAFDQSAYR